ncbi:MAG: hypothetical protein KUG81_09555 [Gammaproteobacteria bacterium]|nr:hypothetical protein [Gammaproteobacteria bacterium]
MSYKKQKEEAERHMKYIILFFLLLGVLSIFSSLYIDKQIRDCHYYEGYRTSSIGVECYTGTEWIKVTDLDKKRKHLFERAQAGDQRARQKLNRLNYEEQLRKQKLRK